MKTKIFFFSIILIFLFGCNEKKSKIEIIPNYDVVYLPASMVSETAVPKDSSFTQELIETFKQIVKAVKIEQKGNKTIVQSFPLGYRFYIDKSGNIVKIKTLSNFKGIGPKLGEQIKEGIKNILIPKLEQFKFVPANLFGKNVKSRYDIKLVILNLSNGISVQAGSQLGHFGEKNIDNDFFVAVEQMPSPIGGVAGIQKRIAYPEIARKAGIQGRVFVKAFIDEKGNVVKTEIIRGIGGGCDQAAQEAIKQTKFEPGRQQGKAVKVQVSIPILFKLG